MILAWASPFNRPSIWKSWFLNAHFIPNNQWFDRLINMEIKWIKNYYSRD